MPLSFVFFYGSTSFRFHSHLGTTSNEYIRRAKIKKARHWHKSALCCFFFIQKRRFFLLFSWKSSTSFAVFQFDSTLCICNQNMNAVETWIDMNGKIKKKYEQRSRSNSNWYKIYGWQQWHVNKKNCLFIMDADGYEWTFIIKLHSNTRSINSYTLWHREKRSFLLAYFSL